MESGEGIERPLVFKCVPEPLHFSWNPVKELKGGRDREAERGEGLRVESGEGIESLIARSVSVDEGAINVESGEGIERIIDRGALYDRTICGIR